MFTTTWLTFFGLAIEVIGLAFLFTELLSSKTTSMNSQEFERNQSELESATRDLIVLTNRALNKLAVFQRGHLSLLELEAEYTSDPDAFKQKAASDPSYAAQLDLKGKTPTQLRRLAVERFVEASNTFPDDKQIERTLDLADAVRSKLQANYATQVKDLQKLQVLARSGVLFVGLGAACQLLDLLFF